MREKLPRKSVSSKKGRQSYILFTLRGVDFAGRIHDNHRRKESFAVDSGASMHMVRQERPEQSRIGDREEIEKSR